MGKIRPVTLTFEMAYAPASQYLAGVNVMRWHVYISKAACQPVEKAGLKSGRQGRIVKDKVTGRVGETQPEDAFADGSYITSRRPLSSHDYAVADVRAG